MREAQIIRGGHGGAIHHSKKHCTGFSLLEVLIASTVFSLGLAGLASLLLASISGSTAARHMGIASMAAASLAEQIRLNPVALNRYLNPPDSLALLCTGADQCTPGQQADADLKRWQLDLADNINGARGIICHDATPTGALDSDSPCTGSGPVVIKIFWTDPGRLVGENRNMLALKVD